MTTLRIPSVLLPVASRTFDLPLIGLNESLITLRVDRTLSSGLNVQPATTTIGVLFEVSFDGLAWSPLASCFALRGGVYVTPLDGQLNLDVFACSIWAPGTPGRRVRATVTVGGAKVRVAGSLDVI